MTKIQCKVLKYPILKYL